MQVPIPGNTADLVVLSLDADVADRLAEDLHRAASELRATVGLSDADIATFKREALAAAATDIERRARFATAAMQGLLANGRPIDQSELARQACDCADFLIAELAKAAERSGVDVSREDWLARSNDAARWRWLRMQGGWPDSEAGVMGFTPEQFDAMADAGLLRDVVGSK